MVYLDLTHYLISRSIIYPLRQHRRWQEVPVWLPRCTGIGHPIRPKCSIGRASVRLHLSNGALSCRADLLPREDRLRSPVAPEAPEVFGRLVCITAPAISPQHRPAARPHLSGRGSLI
jgi:hypothetical protein